MRGGKPIYKRRSRVGRKLFRGTPSTRHKRSRSTRKDSRFWYAQMRRQSLYSNSQNCYISKLLPMIKGRADTGTIIDSDGFKSSEVCTDIPFTCTLKNVSLGTITEIKIYT